MAGDRSADDRGPARPVALRAGCERLWVEDCPYSLSNSAGDWHRRTLGLRADVAQQNIAPTYMQLLLNRCHVGLLLERSHNIYDEH